MGSGASSSKYAVTISRAPQISSVEWMLNSGMRLGSMTNGDFTPVTPIGKGKFGNVFLCKHRSGKHCAVKYISLNFINEAQAAGRIQQELDTLATVQHPFIIPYFGSFMSAGCLGLVFEYAVGGELYSRMKKVHKMTEETAKFYFCEIASALGHLHDNRYVYRDLKPENILLDMGGHVKICDFGFAARTGGSNALATSTGTGSESQLLDGCGTAMYVAPEIAEGFMKRPHGFPVDWWGLGCVLFEMITGSPPFGDTEKMSKFEVFNNIANKEVSCPIMMSKPVKDVIKGLLTKDAKARFSFEEVRKSEWMTTISWENVNSRALQPPWVPTIPSAPSTANFVSWDMSINVNEPADVMAQSYCRQLSLTSPPGGGSDGSQSAALSSNRGSSVMGLGRAESIGKLGKAPSRKASFSAASGVNGIGGVETGASASPSSAESGKTGAVTANNDSATSGKVKVVGVGELERSPSSRMLQSNKSSSNLRKAKSQRGLSTN